MNLFFFITYYQNQNGNFKSIDISAINENLREKLKYYLKKCGILIISYILLFLSINIDINFLLNDLFFSRPRKYHYYLKYFKSHSFIINNITIFQKIALVNEIMYLHDIFNIVLKCKIIVVNISFSNINLKQFSRVFNPKISLIITLYNQEQYILKIYSCILSQTLKQIEIIFIDDNSIDQSFQIIKQLMEKDKRITYIKNKNNKGQFYSRNRGVLFSRGKYILIIDPDDFLLNNILMKSYKVAIKFKLDIVQFYHTMGNYNQNHLHILNKYSKPIQKPDIEKIFFNNPTRYLWDKLIRKSTFIKSIYFMREKYRKERFIIHNDEIACFGIFKTANSYGQIEEVGYYYNRNISNSTTSKNFLHENINGRFHCIFSIMKYYFEQSANNPYEKINGGYKFFTYRIVRIYEDKIQFLSEGFDFIINVIDIYLECPFFNSAQKQLLKQFELQVNSQKLKHSQGKSK